jgi:hypothetical protein
MYYALQGIKLSNMVHRLTHNGTTHIVHSSSSYCHKYYSCGFDCKAVDAPTYISCANIKYRFVRIFSLKFIWY